MIIQVLIKHSHNALIYTRQKKATRSAYQPSDGSVSFISVPRYVTYCCIKHPCDYPLDNSILEINLTFQHCFNQFNGPD